MLTQQAFASDDTTAGAPVVSSSTGGSLHVAPVAAVKVERVTSDVSQLKSWASRSMGRC